MAKLDHGRPVWAYGLINLPTTETGFTLCLQKVIITIFHVFDKVEESMNTSKRDTDNKKKNPIQLLEKKNTTAEIFQKYTRWV